MTYTHIGQNVLKWDTSNLGTDFFQRCKIKIKTQKGVVKNNLLFFTEVTRTPNLQIFTPHTNMLNCSLDLEPKAMEDRWKIKLTCLEINCDASPKSWATVSTGSICSIFCPLPAEWPVSYLPFLGLVSVKHG